LLLIVSLCYYVLSLAPSSSFHLQIRRPFLLVLILKKAALEMLTSSSIDSDLAEQGNDAGIMTRKSSIGKIANIVGPSAKLINHRRITSSFKTYPVALSEFSAS